MTIYQSKKATVKSEHWSRDVRLILKIWLPQRIITCGLLPLLYCSWVALLRWPWASSHSMLLLAKSCSLRDYGRSTTCLEHYWHIKGAYGDTVEQLTVLRPFLLQPAMLCSTLITAKPHPRKILIYALILDLKEDELMLSNDLKTLATNTSACSQNSDRTSLLSQVPPYWMFLDRTILGNKS